ncbi:nose resistant to fluoxetine protein 6 [Nephila pilipes]|uniref:Nose resistant to fluoxetine protein 6 n=1 Tax=Nephila pilipes TaxID=299642 RepID=A0A8X6QG44_NEPPI|nr:nose resistant to fluoxetine protein 6 [Nephila pilipes]
MINGILTGTLSSYGSYDQCVATIIPKNNIRAQYCTIEAWPPLPPKPRFYALNKRLDAFKRFENDTGMMGRI